MTNTGKVLTMTYRNYRGEVSERKIIPNRLWWGSTEYHPEDQWILSAMDLEKDQSRDFALRDCQFTNIGYAIPIQNEISVPLSDHIWAWPYNPGWLGGHFRPAGTYPEKEEGGARYVREDCIPEQNPYSYIGKDGKSILARTLEDQRDEALAQHPQLLATIRAQEIQIAELEKRLDAQGEVEPVAWRFRHVHLPNEWKFAENPHRGAPWTDFEPLYAHPATPAPEEEE